jgi:hypothetical protein
MELEGQWLDHFVGWRSGGLACSVGESATRFDMLVREVRPGHHFGGQCSKSQDGHRENLLSIYQFHVLFVKSKRVTVC